MKKAVHKHHFQKGVSPTLGNESPVKPRLLQCCMFGYLYAVNKLKGQSPLGSHLPKHFWKVEGVVSGKVLGDFLDGVTFTGKVHFPADGTGELPDQSNRIVDIG